MIKELALPLHVPVSQLVRINEKLLLNFFLLLYHVDNKNQVHIVHTDYFDLLIIESIVKLLLNLFLHLSLLNNIYQDPIVTKSLLSEQVENIIDKLLYNLSVQSHQGHAKKDKRYYSGRPHSLVLQ